MSLSRVGRRGTSLVLVLAVLSVSVGLAYAVLRTQSTTICLSRNTNRQDAARQAAISGLSAAIHRMHVQSQWQGVGSTWSSSLSTTDSFAVSYTVGDPSLTSSQPNYQDYPYRVTVLSTGYSQDPAVSANVATYSVRAIVRLVPKKLGDDPSGWSALAPYSVYQWKPAGSSSGSAFQVDVPCQFEGGVRVKQSLDVCYDYPSSSTVRDRLLKDFNAMRTAGLGDYRPFTGQISIPTAGLPQSVLDSFTDLGLTVQNTSSTDAVTWQHPGAVSTYQIYPGGPTYNVPAISGTLQNVTLQPDPLTNPLGVFYTSSRLFLYDNVTVNGTLIADSGNGDIFIEGTNVSASPVNLPALDGTTMPVQLPVMLVKDDFRAYAGSQASIQGMVAVWNEVAFRKAGQQSINFTLEGCLLGRQIYVRARDEWNQSDSWWNNAYNDFLYAAQHGGTPYFPVWLQTQKGLQYATRVHLKPSSTAVTYHWKNATDPIYVADPADTGLRWDIVDWKENP